VHRQLAIQQFKRAECLNIAEAVAALELAESQDQEKGFKHSDPLNYPP